MTRLDGIQLIQKIRNGKVKDGSKIKAVFDDGINQRDVATMIYKNDELIWQPGKFKVSMLYDSYYRFEIIEDNDKLEKIEHFDLFDFFTGYDYGGTNKSLLKDLEMDFQHINNELACLIDHINKIEEKLDEK